MSFDYGKYCGEIELPHGLLSRKEERSWFLTPPRDGERHDIVLYLGCNVKDMRSGDPARILDAAAPGMTANGVDPDRARGLIIKLSPPRPDRAEDQRRQ